GQEDGKRRAPRDAATPRSEAPGRRRGLTHAAKLPLPADGDAGSAARTTGTGTARAVQRRWTLFFHHELDPQRLVIAVVRRLVGGAQRIQVLDLHTPGSGGELGELEDHERPLVHFLQGQGQGLPRRLDPELGAALDRGSPDVLGPFSVTLEDDRVGDRARVEPAEITRNAQPAQVPGANGGIPGRLHLTGVLAGRDAIV